MVEPALVVGLGEVLWDMLPSGKVLGGAPANFAYMANVLGERGIVASRIGSDELGSEAFATMQRLGLDTSCVQLDEVRKTGVANVSIDAAGQPNFTIAEQVAWDCLDWTPQWERLSSQADVICFGSLAQRSPLSAITIERFIENARGDALRIFDVNLRQTFYDRDVLCRSFKKSDIVKVNDEELHQVAFVFDLNVDNEAVIARTILCEFGLKLICVTRGARGSLLVSREEAVEHAGYCVKVVDAVGAGDAFTACLAYYYRRGYPLEAISQSANRFASWVATQTGAMPPVTPDELQRILRGTASMCETSAGTARIAP